MRQIAHSLRGGAGATTIRLKPSHRGRKHFIQPSDNQVEHLCFYESFDQICRQIRSQRSRLRESWAKSYYYQSKLTI